MFVVDTNVLVYAADSHSTEHRRCRDLIEHWRREPLPWFTTWPVITEFLRVVTHPRVLRRPWNLADGWSYVKSLLASPSLQLLVPGPHHVEVAGKTFAEHPDLRANILHDAHTAILMREHGIRQIYTRDKAFRHFPFLEVIDPIEPR